jgi:hypothetical protein
LSLAVQTEPPALLPFVTRASLWQPATTGNWAEDNATGREHAEALLHLIAETNTHPMLGQVVQAIAKSGQWGGVEVGFFQRIAERAV